MIPHLGFGCIVILNSKILLKIQQYMITIGSFLEYSCHYFKDMVAKALGLVDAFIHAPNFSFNEVKHFLDKSILTQHIP
jgi:hypothetical protein